MNKPARVKDGLGSVKINQTDQERIAAELSVKEFRVSRVSPVVRRAKGPTARLVAG